MRDLGAEVIEVGEDFDAARDASEAYAAEHAPELLVDGDDPRISTGAATLALELTDAVAAGDLPAPVVVSVPVGNGALINGVGSWLRASCPACRVVGVQAEGAAAMTLSFQAGRPIDTDAATTYADGIASRVAIPRAVELMPGRVDEMRLVTEAALHADPGRADRRARDHRRGRRGGVLGRAPGRASDRPARPSSSSRAATSDLGPRPGGARDGDACSAPYPVGSAPVRCHRE